MVVTNIPLEYKTLMVNETAAEGKGEYGNSVLSDPFGCEFKTKIKKKKQSLCVE